MAEVIELPDVGSAHDEGVDQPEGSETIPSFPDVPASESADFLDTPAPEAADSPDTPASESVDFLEIPASVAASIHKRENEPKGPTRSIEAQRRELTKTEKVAAFLRAVKERYGLSPKQGIYDEFVLGKNKRDLYLKDGTQVTWKNNSTRYLVLRSIGDAEYIRTHLFPGYTTTIHPKPTRQQVVALTAADSQMTAALQGIETVELQDLPQRASNVDIAIQTLVAEQETSFGGLPEREILGLNEALKRTRGALVDNLAKLSQLDADITQAEQELGGEEAANDPEKKRRIQERLNQQRDERASRLEASAVNREALRSQISRIREAIERVLNEDTTLAERLRTLFREQGVTIASVLTALGFIVSTIVLAIQNTLGGGWPAPSGRDGVTDWVKKPLKTLASWLKALAEKTAAALPGIIGAIVSWLLKTTGSVAVWLAEHLWALAVALVAAAAVYMRDYRATK